MEESGLWKAPVQSKICVRSRSRSSVVILVVDPWSLDSITVAVAGFRGHLGRRIRGEGSSWRV